jgi:hypothetical protein
VPKLPVVVLLQVAHNIREQQERLGGVYTDMQERFVKNGLNLEEIAKVRKGFRGTDNAVMMSPGRGSITPRVYTEDYPGGPLPWSAVRLLVLPLNRTHKLSSAGDCFQSLIQQIVVRFHPSGNQQLTVAAQVNVLS